MVRQLSLAVQELVPSAGVITDLRWQIRHIDEEFISVMIARSKELWAEQGEKPTEYFFNLEKMRQHKKEMTELKSHPGKLLSDRIPSNRQSSADVHFFTLTSQAFMITEMEKRVCETCLKASTSVSLRLSDQNLCNRREE